jgi:hypothetical protein
MDGGVTAAYWYGDLAEVRGATASKLARVYSCPPTPERHLC